MINYFDWPIKKLSVTRIRLDARNPRLSGLGDNPNQPAIIRFLIDHERTYDLARSIVKRGYFPNEFPIVVQEKNRFIVVEGNRRVNALKLILKPDLIHSNTKRRNLNRLIEETGFPKKDVVKIPCIIAPSREASHILIINRHKEGAIKRWETTNQDRFIYQIFSSGTSIEDVASQFDMPSSEVIAAIKRYSVYEEIKLLDLEDEVAEFVLNEKKFSITTVERIYSTSPGKEFLAFGFTTSGMLVPRLPMNEHRLRLSQIINDLASGKINSRSMNEAPQRNKYFENIQRLPIFDLSIAPLQEIPKDKSPEKENGTAGAVGMKNEDVGNSKGTTKSRSSRKTRYIPSAVTAPEGTPRLHEIIKELKKLKIDSFPNAYSILFRSFLEMYVYEFVRANNKIGDIKRKEIDSINSRNDKRIAKIKKWLTEDLGIAEENFTEEGIRKGVGIQVSLGANWSPNLYTIMEYLKSSEELIPDFKLRQAISQYMKGNGQFINHSEFNLLVHNEYWPADATSLKVVLTHFIPILTFLSNELKSN